MPSRSHPHSSLQVEELFLQFAKKASSFNSWLEDAEEDLTDPVRCNSLEEIRVRKEKEGREGREERERRKGGRRGRRGGKGEREGEIVIVAMVCLCRVSERHTLSSRRLRRR